MPDVSEYEKGLLTAHHIAKTHSICIVAIGVPFPMGLLLCIAIFPINRQIL